MMTINMTCEEARKYFRALATETLDEGTSVTLRAHLLSCESCSSDYWDEIEAVVDSGEVELPALPEPDMSRVEEIRQRVMEGRREERRASFMDALRVWLRPLAYAGAAVLLALVVIQYRQLSTYRETLAAVNNISIEAASFRQDLAESGDVLRAVSKFKAYSDRGIVVPSVSGKPANLEILAAAVNHDPRVAEAYRTALNRWGETLYQVGDALFDSDRLDDAAKIYEALYTGTKSRGAGFALAEIYKVQAWNQKKKGREDLFRQKQHDIIGVYRELQATVPGQGEDPRPYAYSGYAYSQLGDYEAAEKAYRQALRIDPKYAKTHFNLAILYRDRMDCPESVRKAGYERNLSLALRYALEYWEDHEWDNRATFTVAIIYAEKRETDKVLKLLKSIASDPTYLTRSREEPAFDYLRSERNKGYEALVSRKDEPRPLGLDQEVYVRGGFYE